MFIFNSFGAPIYLFTFLRIVFRKRYHDFATMVQDRQTHVGCAVVKFMKGSSYCNYWVCNYAIRNVRGYPVYVSGQPLSGCTLGRNKDYPSLCRPDEPIIPEPHTESSSSTSLAVAPSSAVAVVSSSRKKNRKKTKRTGKGKRLAKKTTRRRRKSNTRPRSTIRRQSIRQRPVDRRRRTMYT